MEVNMLEMTESACKELEAYFADKPKESIRVYLTHGGCSGPRLALALDTPGEDDSVFEQGGFTLCINADLLSKIESATVDLGNMGFEVHPKVPFAPAKGSACGGCSGGCGG